jgi:2-methylisocitrate lyase-like PEP mutase family enzyme
MTAWTKLVAQVQKDHGTRGIYWTAVMSAESNGSSDAESYESLSYTSAFEENEAVRAYFESIGYTY